jgi:hypothetical protein
VSRHGPLALAAAIAAALLGGCGGVRAADLFVVTRTGSTAQAHLTLLVNEEGVTHCNGGPPRKLSDPQLVQARAIQEELHDSAAAGLSLPPRPGSVLSYDVREEAGSVHFSDNSSAQPNVLRQLALFVLQVAQRVCHLPQ